MGVITKCLVFLCLFQAALISCFAINNERAMPFNKLHDKKSKGKKEYWSTNFQDGKISPLENNLAHTPQHDRNDDPAMWITSHGGREGDVAYVIAGSSGGIMFNIRFSPAISLEIPSAIAFDANIEKMFIYDSGSEAIYRANIDGSEAELVIHTTGTSYGIALDSDLQVIFYTNFDYGKIYAVTYDGIGHHEIKTDFPIEHPCGIIVDQSKGKIYWTDEGFDGVDSYIVVANYDGTEAAVLHHLYQALPSALTADFPNDKLYWVDEIGSKIMMSNINGTNVERLGVGFGRLCGVELAYNGYLYIISRDGFYQRLSVGGGDVEGLVGLGECDAITSA